MFITLFIHELQNFIYSLRFQISFAIVLLVFIFGTVSYIVSYTEAQDNYTKLVQEQRKELENRAKNITNVATYHNNFIMAPQAGGFMDDCKESVTPNRIRYSAFNVFGFDVRSESTNPLLKKTQYGLNWSFILTMILSFVTLLFAFDAVSGEKEARTLALVFSNIVPRGLFLISKLFSIVTAVFTITITGVIFSILIVTLSGKIAVNGDLVIEIIGFLLLSLLFIGVMAIIGLLASTLCKQTNISLLICLTVWVFFAVILPNSSLFFAKKIFSIPTLSEVNKMINDEKEDINKNAPPGSWSSIGGQPFYPKHELRARNQTNLMNAEKRHRDAYYNQMFNQFERTQALSIFSPIAQFEYMSESILAGGYLRFRKNWNDLHVYQESFLKWFKDIDAKDENSPHWYNPYEEYSTSSESVSVDQIPVYIEKKASLTERLIDMRAYLISMIVLMGVLFIICFNRFLHYDMR